MIRSFHLVLLAMGLTACSASAPVRFFTLMPAANTPMPTSGPHGVTDKLLVVGPVTIPAAINQSQIVLSRGDHEMDMREYERWASPLKDEITAGLAARLAPLVADATVAAYPQMAGDPADVRILVDFSRMELRWGEKVLLDALWTIKRKETSESRRGRTAVSIAITGEGYESLVDAQGKALDRLAHDLATSLRELPP